jgi:hypothetical protein
MARFIYIHFRLWRVLQFWFLQLNIFTVLNWIHIFKFHVILHDNVQVVCLKGKLKQVKCLPLFRLRTETDPVPDKFSSSEYRTTSKVQQLNSPECYTPSSDKVFSYFLRSGDVWWPGSTRCQAKFTRISPSDNFLVSKMWFVICMKPQHHLLHITYCTV